MSRLLLYTRGHGSIIAQFYKRKCEFRALDFWGHFFTNASSVTPPCLCRTFATHVQQLDTNTRAKRRHCGTQSIAKVSKESAAVGVVEHSSFRAKEPSAVYPSHKPKNQKPSPSSSISYEPYWSTEEVSRFEKQNGDLVVRGRVFIPAFNTGDARVLVNENTAEDKHQPSYSGCSHSDDVKKVKIFGFLARNRSFHGDEVIAIKQRRRKDENLQNQSDENNKSGCRIVAIEKRNSALDNFVATFDVDAFFDDAQNFRCQPFDTRWPAFTVSKDDVSKGLYEVIHSYKAKRKLLCSMKFKDWTISDMEPRAVVTKVLGEVEDADAQMRATMLFYQLDPSDFPADVLANLKQLVEEGNEERHLNRANKRDLLVIPIDPADAKDLDDALSIELKEEKDGNLIYQVGVHVADVSHYVKEGSLLDLHARTRATSVYLEHKVYPMLPPLLSENLCSLVPGSDKLAFSMFAKLTQKPTAEQVGTNLYIKGKPKFQLTTINTRRRFSYQQAQDIINATDVSINGTIAEFEAELKRNQNAPAIDVAPQIQDTIMRLHYVSQTMRHFRLNKRGAVHVDVDGSVKCRIPKIVDNVADSDGIKIEQTPKKTHELVEELMLLANTQAAKLLAKTFKSYFLRIHDDTSRSVKNHIIKMLPQRILDIINPQVLSVQQLLKKCAHHMEPSAFQNISFIALQEFKEAVYSPISEASAPEDDSGDKNSSGENKNGKITFHWGLALPTYLHFTSPIRRYSDLYTHRMLKTVLDGTCTEHSINVLAEICKQCNVQKRKAFDTQKHYRNVCFNRFLQWACTRHDGNTAYCENNDDFARDHGGTWGYIYEDACISGFIIDGEQKTSVIFYIPLLGEQRSTSCKTLQVVPVMAHYSQHKQSFQESGMVGQYLQRATGEIASSEAQALDIVTAAGVEMHLQRLAKVRVLLVPGAKMWGVRLF